LVAESAARATTSTNTPRVGRLDSLPRCRIEARKLYVDGRTGRISTADCSRLASTLDLVARLIERGELEARIERLEAAVQ
jgi:hypothetical protein